MRRDWDLLRLRYMESDLGKGRRSVNDQRAESDGGETSLAYRRQHFVQPRDQEQECKQQD
jgi:hypothetical protein